MCSPRLVPEGTRLRRAAVHLINNLFKILLLRKSIDWKVTLRFGLPALVAAIPGVFLLKGLSLFPILFTTTLWHVTLTITPVKLTIGFLLLLFATLEQFHPLTFKRCLRNSLCLEKLMIFWPVQIFQYFYQKCILLATRHIQIV